MSENINSRSGQDVSEQVYTGEHSTKTDSMLDNGETVNWEFDEKALFETISHKIYQSDEAAIREPIFNGVSAALQASEDGYIDNPRVNVYLINDDGEFTLVIQDNGMGVSRNMVEESMAYVGRSQNRYVANLMGKFGFGFLAAFRLVTSTGVFFMHTHHRETEENFCGVWSNNGFEIDTDNELSQALDDDEYGTRLEFPVKESIKRGEIYDWVSKNAKYARIPIDYQEIGFKRDNVTETYGNYSFEDSYDKPLEFGYHIETEYFTARCHLEANNRTLCLDAPIQRSGKIRRFNNDIPSLPYRLDIRFKNENGGIVTGPNEGKTPVNDAEYAEIPDDLKDEFIKKSEMHEDDINIPHPTGSRDNLTESLDFWKYLHEQFKEMDRETVNTIAGKLDTPSELTDEELFHLTHNNHILYGSYDIPEDKIEKIEILLSEVSVIGEEGQTLSTSKWASDIDRESNGPVFMGVKIHDAKRELVQDTYRNCTVVKVKGSNQTGISASDTYNVLESVFRWRKIKDIDPDDDEFKSASQEIKDKLTRDSNNRSETKQDILDRDIKIHHRNYVAEDRKTMTRTVQEILDGDIFADDLREELILFPTTSDYAISDNYDLIKSNYCLAKTTKKTADKLCESDKVVVYDDLIENIKNETITTSEGEYIGDDLVSNDNVVFLEASEENVAEMQNDTEFMKNCERAICDNFCGWKPANCQDLEAEDIIFAPITKETYSLFFVIADELRAQTLFKKPSYYHLKAYSELTEWRDSEEFKTLIKTLDVSRAPNVLLETWIAAHESGLDIEEIDS